LAACSDVKEASLQWIFLYTLLKEDLKGQFLRPEKKARNYFTHDISAIPQPQEALALVADACNLSMLLMRIKSPGTPS